MIGFSVEMVEPKMSFSVRQFTIVVPVPPLTNHRFKGTVRRSKTGKRYAGFRRSSASTNYQQRVRDICFARKLVPIRKDVGMCIVWYRDAKRGDVPDRWKDLCDALQSRQRDAKTKKYVDSGFGAFVNDSQIADFRVRRDDSDPDHPRCEVTVWEL